MSRIQSMKNRLGDMFLRDRGQVDEKTASLIKSEIRRSVENYFAVSDYEVQMAPCDTGEVEVTVRVKGYRLRNGDD